MAAIPYSKILIKTQKWWTSMQYGLNFAYKSFWMTVYGFNHSNRKKETSTKAHFSIRYISSGLYFLSVFICWFVFGERAKCHSKNMCVNSDSGNKIIAHFV